MEQTLSKQEKAFLLLSCSFVVLLVVSNVIAGKIITIGGLFAPAAVICYSLTFAATDTLAEIFGKERTRFVVNVGFFVTILSALFIRLAILMPGAPFGLEQEVFEAVLGGNLRIVIASLIAYLISQHHDIWAFTFWKEKTKGRHLWIRNNLSTGVSQMLDTTIFITLAFSGTGAPVLSMITGQYLIKLLIGVCDTPIVYLMVHAVKQYAGLEARNVEEVDSH